MSMNRKTKRDPKVIRRFELYEIFRMYHILRGYGEAKPDCMVLDNLFKYAIFSRKEGRAMTLLPDGAIHLAYNDMKAYFSEVLKEIDAYVKAQGGK